MLHEQGGQDSVSPCAGWDIDLLWKTIVYDPLLKCAFPCVRCFAIELLDGFDFVHQPILFLRIAAFNSVLEQARRGLFRFSGLLRPFHRANP